MPWQEIRVEEQRLLMIRDHEEGMSISELAEVYGVSRKTVYKWLERHDEQGFLGYKHRAGARIARPTR
uniref:Resolvase helix-turn-helix domain protein n=1 Tax=Solibacter usitatus (strain Ellin6076) TaxID=234267 RepID=Q01SC5_SOLUE